MKRRVRSGSPYEDTIGFCRALVVGDRVLVSGTAPVPERDQKLAPDAHGQMMRCGAIVARALSEAGATMNDVVRTRMYITDPKDAEAVGNAHRELFGGARPAATMVVVAALLDPAWKIELEVEAVLPPE